MGFPIYLPIRQGNSHNIMLCIIALGCFFLWHKCSTVLVQTAFCHFAESMTEKKQRRVESAEADKRTMQAQRNEGRGLLAAEDLPCGAARNKLTGEA